MKPRDCFGVVVRTVGLLLVLFSLFYFYGAVAATVSPALGRGGTPVYYIGIGVVMMSVGLYLLRGAPHLLRFAYGKDQDAQDDQHDTT
jgi:hypothetical protein